MATGSIYSSINPNTTSGTQLATLLDNFKDAVVAGFCTNGGARPTNLNSGGYWVDQQAAPVWSYKMYDGTNDYEIFQLNVTTGAVSFGSTSEQLEIAKISDDSLGAILKLYKKRLTGSGQTIVGDTIGEINFTGYTDTATDEIMVQIKTVSTDNVTTAAHGAYLIVSTTPDNGSTLTERLRVNTDGNVGFGETLPLAKIHTKGTSTTGNIRNTVEEDSVTGPKFIANKKRIAGSGQTLSADEIGNVDFMGTDQNGADITMGRVQVKASENTTNTQYGSTLSVQTVETGTAILTDQVTIDGAGNTTIAGNLTMNGTGATAFAGDLDVNGTGISDFAGDLTVQGNLTVQGTTVTMNTATVDIEDANITINKNGTQASADNLSGLTVEMSDATNASLLYDKDVASKWIIGEVGLETEVATVSATQTLTNKTLTGADIQTPSRLDAKQDTFANLTTYALTASNGQFCFATDIKAMFQVVDTALVSVGGGAGGLDVFDTEDFEQLTAVNTSGNHVAFLGGGILDGAFSIETIAPLSSGHSGKYTAGAASINDYLEIKTIDIDPKQQSEDVKIRLITDLSSFSSDVTLMVYDKTNAAVISSALDVLPGNGAKGFFETIITIPSTCLQISFGFHMLSAPTNTESFLFDDIEFSTNIINFGDVNEASEMHSVNFDTPNFWGATGVSDDWDFSLLPNLSTSKYITVANSGGRTVISALRDIDLYVKFQAISNVAGNISIRRDLDNTNITRVEPVGSTFSTSDDVKIKLSAGEGIYILCESLSSSTGGIVLVANASSEHVLTPAKSNMSDWLSYTPTYQGFGTPTAVTAEYRIVGSDLQMRGVFTPSTATAVEARIGFPTGYTSHSALPVLSSTLGNIVIGRANALVVQPLMEPNTAYFTMGVQQVSTFGLAKSNADVFAATGSVSFNVSIPMNELSSDVQFLAAVPVQKTTTLLETQPTSIDAGAFTANTWITRSLNTQVDDTSFCSLSASQFTLSPGQYRIKIFAPANRVDSHKAKLYNITTAADEFTCTSSRSPSSIATMNPSVGARTLTLTTATTFEVRHMCETSRVIDGLGIASDAASDTTIETFTTVEITKLR